VGRLCRADQGSAREVRPRVRVGEDVVGERLVVVDEPGGDHANAVDEVAGREVGEISPVRRRMTRTDAQRGAVRELQLHDTMATRHGLSVHQLDRDNRERTVIDAVDEIAHPEIGDRSIAGRRRDRCRRRGAVAIRAAGGARSVDGLEATGDRRALRHRATDLRARAARTSAAGRPLRAGRANERARPVGLAGSVSAIRMGAAAGVAARSAVEDVVAGVDADASTALEALTVRIGFARHASARAAGSAAPR